MVFDSSGSNAQWLRHRIDLAKRKGPPRLVLEWKLEMTHVENVRMEVLFFFFLKNWYVYGLMACATYMKDFVDTSSVVVDVFACEDK